MFYKTEPGHFVVLSFGFVSIYNININNVFKAAAVIWEKTRFPAT